MDAGSEMIVVRYADDAVLGFQYREEGEKFLKELGEPDRVWALCGRAASGTWAWQA